MVTFFAVRSSGGVFCILNLIASWIFNPAYVSLPEILKVRLINKMLWSWGYVEASAYDIYFHLSARCINVYHNPGWGRGPRFCQPTCTWNAKRQINLVKIKTKTQKQDIILKVTSNVKKIKLNFFQICTFPIWTS